MCWRLLLCVCVCVSVWCVCVRACVRARACVRERACVRARATASNGAWRGVSVRRLAICASAPASRAHRSAQCWGAAKRWKLESATSMTRKSVLCSGLAPIQQPFYVELLLSRHSTAASTWKQQADVLATGSQVVREICRANEYILLGLYRGLYILLRLIPAGHNFHGDYHGRPKCCPGYTRWLPLALLNQSLGLFFESIWVDVRLGRRSFSFDGSISASDFETCRGHRGRSRFTFVA